MHGADPETLRRLEGSIQIVKGMSLARQLLREADFAASLAKKGHTLLTLGVEIEQLEQRLKDLPSRFSETTPVKSPESEYQRQEHSTAL
jgi:replicative DNA helicase